MASREGGWPSHFIFWMSYPWIATSKGYIAVLPYSTGDGRDDPKSGNNRDTQRRWAEVDVPKLASLAKEMQRKHGADPRRTYIAGFSNGGFVSVQGRDSNTFAISLARSRNGGFAQQGQDQGFYSSPVPRALLSSYGLRAS